MAILSTAVWRIRPAGNNLNGGGYDSGIAGAATDYSQQNTAQATGSNATCATGTSTFIDATANAFTAAMIGNCIQIASGTNFTAGFYFVTGFTSASTVTLDRSPVGGVSGTVGVWKLGGGWANFANLNFPGPGFTDNNVIYVLGSGTPNPASYTYDYDITTTTTTSNLPPHLYVFNDPATPGYKAPPDVTGGMPVIKFDVAGNIWTANTNGCTISIRGLWFVGTTVAATKYVLGGNSVSYGVFGCVLDQFSFDVGLSNVNIVSGISSFITQVMAACEVFSSVAGSGAGASTNFLNTGFLVVHCNIHDCVNDGIVGNTSSYATIANNIVAKNVGNGINVVGSGGTVCQAFGNTVDGNGGHGITFGSSVGVIFNNILSNHTTAGKFGLNVGAGNFGTFSLLADYNVYYNNNGDVNGVAYGPHDTHGGSNPYVAQSTENYTLA